MGAQEVDHLFAGYTVVPDPQQTIRWIDEVVKANLEPTPAVEPYVITATTGQRVVAINIPPSLRLVAHRVNNALEFPVRRVDSRGFMTLGEVEARMQDQTRVHRLRLEQIGADAPVGLDATVDRDLGHNDWRVASVGEDVVVLGKGAIEVPGPLAYIQTVYRAGLLAAEWVIDLDCYLRARYEISGPDPIASSTGWEGWCSSSPRERHRAAGGRHQRRRD